MALQHQWNDDSENQASKRTGWMPDISPQLLRRIRAAAAKRDLSIQKYIEDVLEQAVPQEEESTTQDEQPHKRRPVSQESLERLRRTREQIMQDRQGRLFDDSTEIIRKMREERSQYLSEL